MAVSPPLDKLRPELRPAVAHALESVGVYNERRGAFLDEFLESHYRALTGENLKRFRDSVDIMRDRECVAISPPADARVGRLLRRNLLGGGKLPRRSMSADDVE